MILDGFSRALEFAPGRVRPKLYPAVCELTLTGGLPRRPFVFRALWLVSVKNRLFTSLKLPAIANVIFNGMPAYPATKPMSKDVASVNAATNVEASAAC